MASGGDKGLAIAKVYAAAMLQLAKSARQEDALGKELVEFAALVERDAALAGFLSSPTVDSAARQRTIEKALRGKLSDLFVDSLQVLNRNERVALLASVSRAYDALLEEAKGRVVAKVRSATALNGALRERLRSTLGKLTGRQVDLAETVDEGLLGGMIVQIGDDQYDGSVTRKLRVLGEKLANRASRELHAGKTYTVGAA